MDGLVNEYEATGRWWLPSRPDRQIGGTLTVDPDGCRLVLDGQLFPAELVPGQVGGGSVRWETISEIHGHTREFEAVSLIDATGLVSPFPVTAATMAGESWDAAAALVGKEHVGASTTYRSVQIRIDTLAEWAGAPGIGLESPESVTVDLQTADLEVVALRGAELRLRCGVNGAFGSDRVSLERNVFFEVDADEDLAWAELLERYVEPLMDFMTFVSLRASSAVIHLKRSDDAAVPSLRLQLPLLRPARRQSDQSADKMLLTRLRSPSPVDQLLANWMADYPSIRMALALLLQPLTAPFIYDEVRFLTAMWSAEALHGKWFESGQLSDIEHAARREKIAEALSQSLLDSETREWVLRLTNRNDKTIREKLEDLAGHSAVVGPVLEAQPRFYSNLTGTRGPLAHQGTGGSLKGADRYFHSEALRWILRGAVLRQLDWSEDQISSTVFRNPEFKRVTRRLKKAPAKKAPAKKAPAKKAPAKKAPAKKAPAKKAPAKKAR